MSKTTHLDGETLKEAFLGGLANLKLHSREVDELNVFPVPDGDTGTNMSLTFQGGVDAIQDASFESVADLGNAFSRGTLLGARGNSGVILSQFFKGLLGGMEDCQTITVQDFLQAFQQGVKKPMKAVINPTEGTILTVMRKAENFWKPCFLLRRIFVLKKRWNR